MSVRLLLAAPEVVPVAVAVGGYHVGSGRTVPSVAALAGLLSVIVGGLVLARSGRRADAGRAGRAGRGADPRTGRRGAVSALVLGTLSAVVGGLHTANSAGGFGTGNGLAGALVALALGLAGAVLGGLALVRGQRGRSYARVQR